MKKRILILMRYSLLCTLLLSTTAMAMEIDMEMDENQRSEYHKVSNLMSQPQHATLIPDVITIWDTESLKVSAPISSNKTSFLYVNLDAETMELKTYGRYEAKYEPNLDELMQYGINNEKINGPINYFNSESCILFPIDSFIFNINGPLIIQAPNISCKGAFFWIKGPLVFRSVDKNCLIDKIEITACNNKKPIFVFGYLNFNEVPKVTLECLNAAEIAVELRGQK